MQFAEEADLQPLDLPQEQHLHPEGAGEPAAEGQGRAGRGAQAGQVEAEDQARQHVLICLILTHSIIKNHRRLGS